MSRSLGNSRTRLARQGVQSSPESLGREAFRAGKAKEANPWGSGADKGKGHAWLRGWERERMAAQKDR